MVPPRKFRPPAVVVLLCWAQAVSLGVAAPSLRPPVPDQREGPLERGFQEPPASARPRVWWHWMAGNVTREGITLDLEWMKRVGIGGIQMFDAGLGVRQVVDKRIVFMTPEWKEMLRYAASEADRLGLEMTMHSAAGWSETGGP